MDQTLTDEFRPVFQALDNDLRTLISYAGNLVQFRDGLKPDSSIPVKEVSAEIDNVKRMFDDMLVRRATWEAEFNSVLERLKAVDAQEDKDVRSVRETFGKPLTFSPEEAAKLVAQSKPCKKFRDEFSKHIGDDDDDDDLKMIVTTGSLLCPITTMRLEDPVRSKTCGHTYSRAAILQLFRSNRQVKCPVSGCKKPVTKEALEADEDAVFQLTQDAEAPATQRHDAVDLDDDDD